MTAAPPTRCQPGTNEPQLTEMALQQARELHRFYLAEPSKPYTAGVLADCIATIENLQSRLAAPARCDAESGWLPIDAAARDGHEVLLRHMPDGPIHAGYFGLAQFAFGAGASTMYPWTVLDNTNGVNQLRDGGETGVTHYRALSPDHGTVAVAEIARDLAECIGRYMSETDYRSRLMPGAAEFVASRGLAHPSADRGTP